MNDRTEELLDYVHDRLEADHRRAFEDELNRNAHLRAELEVVEAVRRETALMLPGAQTHETGWEALSKRIDAEERRVPANDNRRFSLAQVAAIALCAMIASQFLTIPFWSDGADPTYVPASSASADVVLQVGFSENATIGQISTLLQELDATIIEGPSAIGLLTLRFADDAARDAAADLLAEQPGLVDIVSRP